MNGTIIPQLRVELGGEERIIQLQNPSQTDIAFVNGLSEAAANTRKYVNVEVLDVHKNPVCTVRISPYDLTLLARGYSTNPEAFKSAQSYEDLAKVCGFTPEGIQTLYVDKNFSLLEPAPYELKGGAQRDPRYAGGYAEQVAEGKAAKGEIKKT